MGAALALAVMLVVIVAILSLAVNTQGPSEAVGQPFSSSGPPRGVRPPIGREQEGAKPATERRRQDRPTRGDDLMGKGDEGRRRAGEARGSARSGPVGSERQGRGRKWRAWHWLVALGGPLGRLSRLGAFFRPGRGKGGGEGPDRSARMEVEEGGGSAKRRGDLSGRRGPRPAGAGHGEGGAPSEEGPSVAERLFDELKPLSSQAEALVVAVVDERTLGPVTRSRLTLRVQPREGGSFEVTTRVAFPTPEERAKVKVGGRVPVRYDSSDHRRVVVEIGGGPGAGAEG